MLLAAYKGHAECVGLLIEAGANPDLTTLEGGSAPLHIAARSGHVEVVRLLIAAGVDRDKAKSDCGATPLHMAAEKGHVRVVRLLIAAGVWCQQEERGWSNALGQRGLEVQERSR